jgi:hypothetical protein
VRATEIKYAVHQLTAMEKWRWIRGWGQLEMDWSCFLRRGARKGQGNMIALPFTE